MHAHWVNPYGGGWTVQEVLTVICCIWKTLGGACAISYNLCTRAIRIYQGIDNALKWAHPPPLLTPPPASPSSCSSSSSSSLSSSSRVCGTQLSSCQVVESRGWRAIKRVKRHQEGDLFSSSFSSCKLSNSEKLLLSPELHLIPFPSPPPFPPSPSASHLVQSVYTLILY